VICLFRPPAVQYHNPPPRPATVPRLRPVASRHHSLSASIAFLNRRSEDRNAVRLLEFPVQPTTTRLASFETAALSPERLYTPRLVRRSRIIRTGSTRRLRLQPQLHTLHRRAELSPVLLAIILSPHIHLAGTNLRSHITLALVTESLRLFFQH
jgi:hypothetical protein